jgi:UPF0176 protein
MKPYRSLLFYKYILIQGAKEFAACHLNFCKSIGIKGRIIIAEEGINGTVSGTLEQCEQYMNLLHSDNRFTDLQFKVQEVDKLAISKIFVRYKKEIVNFNQPHVDVWKQAGKYLEPSEFIHEKDTADAVLLDVRNKVEWEVGQFKNAVTLPMDHFRDLPTFLPQIERYRDQKIIAYCTGGIRCEKATAFLLQNGFKNVYHLHGGILEYAKHTGGKDFDGKCYVFDERLVVDVNEVNPTVISKCFRCGVSSTRLINCSNPECNNHIVMCDECGWKHNGACSDECSSHPRNRSYVGTGYYVKGKASAW